jgi:hypothetical protein
MTRPRRGWQNTKPPPATRPAADNQSKGFEMNKRDAKRIKVGDRVDVVHYGERYLRVGEIIESGERGAFPLFVVYGGRWPDGETLTYRLCQPARGAEAFTLTKVDDEYAVVCRVNGRRVEARTYYTDDKTDARETRDAMNADAAKYRPAIV